MSYRIFAMAGDIPYICFQKIFDHFVKHLEKVYVYIQRGHHQKILNTEQKSSNTENTESKNETKILKY